MMDEQQHNRSISGCKRTCGCSNANCPNRRRMQKEKACENQGTFISFVCETISIIAFIIFGSIVFWMAVGGILVDSIKKLYYSDRHVKLVVGIFFSVLLLTLSFHCIINRTDRKLVDSSRGKDATQHAGTKESNTQAIKMEDTHKVSSIPDKTQPPKPPPPPPSPPPPPPEYMRISLKEKHLENLNGEARVKNIDKKSFTLAITDEKKKEVFRTTKTVFIPELAVQEKRPPLVVVLKEILLEDY